jgi:hypothetical protein
MNNVVCSPAYAFRIGWYALVCFGTRSYRLEYGRMISYKLVSFRIRSYCLVAATASSVCSYIFWYSLVKSCTKKSVCNRILGSWTRFGSRSPLVPRVEPSKMLRCLTAGAGGLYAQKESAGRKFCVPIEFCDRPLF